MTYIDRVKKLFAIYDENERCTCYSSLEEYKAKIDDLGFSVEERHRLRFAYTIIRMLEQQGDK